MKFLWMSRFNIRFPFPEFIWMRARTSLSMILFWRLNKEWVVQGPHIFCDLFTFTFSGGKENRTNSNFSLDSNISISPFEIDICHPVLLKVTDIKSMRPLSGPFECKVSTSLFSSLLYSLVDEFPLFLAVWFGWDSNLSTDTNNKRNLSVLFL